MRWLLRTVSLLFIVGFVSQAHVVAMQPEAVTAYRENLLVNPGAEADQGWAIEQGDLQLIAYGTSGFPTASSPGPVDRGSRFFAGGEAAKTVATQDINLAAWASLIDAGKLKVGVGGWFGGFENQLDNAYLEVNIYDGSNIFLDQVLVGFVSPIDRQNITGFLPRSDRIVLPNGTRSLTVRLQMDRSNGELNDGYADNLVVMLESVHTVFFPTMRR